MLCTKPLIQILDTKLQKLYNKQFISYKHFKDKKNLNNYLTTKKISMYPCRSCLACINMNRFHWVKKLELEKQLWKYTYFITITYNDDNVPSELNVRHLQNFIKYLRKLINPYPLRYFACGEYGERTKRPHYHAIIFTDYEFQLDYLKTTKSGILFNCNLMNKAWKNQGYIWVAHDINSASFAYVATYSNKSFLKQKHNEIKKSFEISKDIIYSSDNLSGFEKYIFFDINFLNNNLLPKSEFIICSKKPPLGSGVGSINSPSSLLKWFDKQEDKKYISGYHIDEFGKKWAIYNAMEYQKSKWLEELDKRKNGYNEFLENRNVYNIIETNKILKQKNIKKLKKTD